MSELNFLLSNYTTDDVLVILIVALLLCVTILRATGFLWEKIKEHFDISNNEDKWRTSVTDGLEEIKTDVKELHVAVDDLEEKADKRGKRLEKVEKYVENDFKREQELIEHNSKMQQMCKRVQARLQDDTRWAFKDAFNYYYKKEKKIDSNSLEALEKKYEHYKAAGGNSFVDNIMDKLRTLPIVEYMEEELEDDNTA